MGLEGLLVVLAAGVFTAVVCGLGTLPFFFVDEISDRTTVVAWGFAGGIMLFASLFGFVVEGLDEGTLFEVGVGLGVASWWLSSRTGSSRATSSPPGRWRPRTSANSRSSSAY